jgi:hypothetical protein
MHMRRVMLYSLIGCCALSITGMLHAQTIIIAGDNVNVHAGPGRTYAIIDVVDRQEHFQVLDEQDQWYKISVEGRIGWISVRSAVSSDGSITELIARADRYFQQRQFLTPAEANAFDLYQEVLRHDPEHRHARRQIDEMARIYKSWAEVAAQRGDDHAAQVYYERHLFVAPKTAGQAPPPMSSDSSQPSAVTQPLRMYRLRTTPTEISPEAMRQMLREFQFNHPADWARHGLSPSITGTMRHDYERLTGDDGVAMVADYATNLLWQQSSPSSPLTWNEAQTYIHQLNSHRHGGHADWRLPTLEELASLLEPAKSVNNLYLDAAFGATQLWCWSADRLASEADKAWYVSFSSGGIQPHHLHASAFVLAVRTLR